VLSRTLAERGHYPSIDVLQSVSRVMHNIIDEDHRKNAEKIRSLMAIYEENKDLIQIGAYKQGSDKQIDTAITNITKINQLLQQEMKEPCMFEDSVEMFKNHL